MDGLQSLLGFTFVENCADRVTIRWRVTAGAKQKHGIIHGGAYCTVVEAAASRGAALWWGDRGTVVGISNHTDFLRPVRGGHLNVTAVPISRGRTQQLWRVSICTPEGDLAATGQVRLQNLPRREAE